MTTTGVWQSGFFDGMPYALLLDGYVAGKSYPVMLFLHGGGEESAIPRMLDPWFNTPDFRSAYPAIVVAPILQGPSLNRTWGGYPVGDQSAEDQALAIVRQVTSQYNGDRNRVYVTGLSLGGHASWDLMIKDNAYDGPLGRVFAAALPLAAYESAPGYPMVAGNGSYQPTQAVIDELRGVPIWANEGNSDWPEFDRAVAAALPNSAHRYMEYSSLGHDVWDTAYPLPAGKPYYDRLLSQSANLDPVASVGSTLIHSLGSSQQLELIYLGYFNRFADASGLDFWSGQNTQAQALG